MCTTLQTKMSRMKKRKRTPRTLNAGGKKVIRGWNNMRVSVNIIFFIFRWMVSLHKQPEGSLKSVELAVISVFFFPALLLCMCPASERLWGKEIECERELMIGNACNWDCPGQWMLWQGMCRSKGLWPRYHTSQSVLIPSITYRVSLSHRVVPASANTHTHTHTHPLEFLLFPLAWLLLHS